LGRNLDALVQPRAQRLGPAPALIRVPGGAQLGQQLIGHQGVIEQLLPARSVRSRWLLCCPASAFSHLGHLSGQSVEFQHGRLSVRRSSIAGPAQDAGRVGRRSETRFASVLDTNKHSTSIILQASVAAKQRFHWIAMKTWLTNR
jgi:hypothetical protein